MSIRDNSPQGQKNRQKIVNEALENWKKNNKPTNTKTANELIAEFMGFDCVDIGTDVTGKEIRFYKSKFEEGSDYPWYKPYKSEHMQFGTSWDWLMPVVHKILKATEPTNEGWTYEYLELEKTRVGNSIDYVYMKVVEFIKRHNSTTQRALQKP